METFLNEFAETSQPDDEAPGLLFVRAVVRSSRWVLAVILLGGVLGIAAGVLQPNRYDSNAKLFLRTGAREQFTSESLVEVDARQPAPAPTMTMADEMQLVSDVAIFERVARELGPRVPRNPPTRRATTGRSPLPIRVFHRVQGWIFRRMDELGADSREGRAARGDQDFEEQRHVSNERGSNVILVSSRPVRRRRHRPSSGADEGVHRSAPGPVLDPLLLENSRSQLEDAKLARDEAARPASSG
jgi:uncharacterized protein involved in exopolysaccharide biosynthesis